MPSDLRISVLINERAGAGHADAGERIQALFTAAGAPVRLERVRDAGDIAARARQAADRSDVLVAAGGDGTVSTVAAVAVGAGLTLGVLPIGTFNHFARDLHLPLDLGAAVGVVVAGHVQPVDVGDVNGRIFVNNSSVGLYPRMIWERDAARQSGRGKWSASALAILRAARNYQTHVARLLIDGQEQVVRTPFIFVGNNRYQVEGFQLGGRSSLREGRLSVFAAPECGRFEIAALPIRALLNRLTTDPHFEAFIAEVVSISLSRARVMVALDGEVAVMRPPLQYRIRSGALRVLLPSPAAI